MKRKANTKAKICPNDMQELKNNFSQILLYNLLGVLPSLVINWNQQPSSISQCLHGPWPKKEVLIAGLKDKRQATAVFEVTRPAYHQQGFPVIGTSPLHQLSGQMSQPLRLTLK